ncbi:hypothetical protein AMTRI_Chr03g52580 [Amborella trichopoda]
MEDNCPSGWYESVTMFGLIQEEASIFMTCVAVGSCGTVNDVSFLMYTTNTRQKQVWDPSKTLPRLPSSNIQMEKRNHEDKKTQLQKPDCEDFIGEA